MTVPPSREDLPVIRPAAFPESAVVAAVSTRNGGISPAPLGMNLSFHVGDREENVRRNREIFFGWLGIRIDELAIPGQVHGTNVSRIGAPGAFPDCDALITDSPRVFLCVSVADCVPVLLFEPAVHAVAAVHAGWRGTVGRILEAAVRKMERTLGAQPGRLRAYLGPAASSCCYAVGEDVAARFDSRFVRRDGARPFVDLKQANAQQLLALGVSPDHIEISPFCTISDSTLFHSYRRDGLRSGRMTAVIGLI
jgi:YfiH family protein